MAMQHMLFTSARTSDANLADVASGVFGALGASDWEERFSTNYPPDGHYYAGYAENAEVTVYDNDDDMPPGYPISVTIEDATWRRSSGKMPTESVAIVDALVGIGFTVFVPSVDWYTNSWDGTGHTSGPTK